MVRCGLGCLGRSEPTPHWSMQITLFNEDGSFDGCETPVAKERVVPGQTQTTDVYVVALTKMNRSDRILQELISFSGLANQIPRDYGRLWRLSSTASCSRSIDEFSFSKRWTVPTVIFVAANHWGTRIATVQLNCVESSTLLANWQTNIRENSDVTRLKTRNNMESYIWVMIRNTAIWKHWNKDPFKWSREPRWAARETDLK